MTLNRLAAAFFAASTSSLDQSGVMGNAFALKPLKSREHPAMRVVFALYRSGHFNLGEAPYPN
jgi:hypothetical protein